jgi:Sec-independent protein secretion pathway component TatC
MLLSLLGYVLLGLLLALPLWRLLRWLGPRSGLYTLQRRYLRPYLPPSQRGALPGSATAVQQADSVARKDRV